MLKVIAAALALLVCDPGTPGCPDGCSVTAETCPRVSMFFPATVVTFKSRPVPFPGYTPNGMALACCDLYGECAWVDFFSDCPFPMDVYSCEWGISNADGTVDCFD